MRQHLCQPYYILSIYLYMRGYWIQLPPSVHHHRHPQQLSALLETPHPSSTALCISRSIHSYCFPLSLQEANPRESSVFDKASNVDIRPHFNVISHRHGPRDHYISPYPATQGGQLPEPCFFSLQWSYALYPACFLQGIVCFRKPLIIVIIGVPYPPV